MTLTARRPSRTQRTQRTRRTLPVAVLATVTSLSFALTACSSDDDDGGADSTTADGASYPMTFSTAWGDSTLDEKPERIAAVGYKDPDIVASLGEVPVVMWENILKQEVWTVDAFDGEEPESTSTFADDGSIDLEEVAAAEPDLILASQMDLADQYDDLSQIAPVIGAETEEDVSGNWQQTVTDLGAALGKESDAEDVIKETSDVAADAKSEHPEFEGKSISMLNYFGLDTIRYLNAEDSDAAELMGSIGFDTIEDSGSFGSDDISAERLDDTAADVMVVMDNSDGKIEDLLDNASFRAIPAVKEGRLLVFHNKAFEEDGKSAYTVNDGDEEHEGNLPWAIAYPGPLSTQWALETLTPLLSDIVEGREVS